MSNDNLSVTGSEEELAIEQQIARDELEDQASEVGALTPREYAALRGMKPQLVYYYIRKGVIEVELCRCGRKIVDVEKTDKILSERKKES